MNFHSNDSAVKQTPNIDYSDHPISSGMVQSDAFSVLSAFPHGRKATRRQWVEMDLDVFTSLMQIWGVFKQRFGEFN